MPCRIHRDYLRGNRMFLTPELEAMLLGVNLSSLPIVDLEALHELIHGKKPVPPANYRPQH